MSRVLQAAAVALLLAGTAGCAGLPGNQAAAAAQPQALQEPLSGLDKAQAAASSRTSRKSSRRTVPPGFLLAMGLVWVVIIILA